MLLSIENFNFFSQVIIPLSSAFIGGYFSIWIFNKGLKKDSEKEKLKRVNENFQTEQFFIYHIKSFIFFINVQINEITTTSKAIKNWNIQGSMLSLLSELRMTELRELSFKELYNIFVIDRYGNTDDKAQDFINLKNCLHNIDDFIIHQKNDNELYSKQLLENIEIWNENIKNLSTIYNSFIPKNENSSDELINICQKYLIIKHQEIIESSSNNNMEDIYLNVIEPLRLEIQNYKNHKDSRLTELIEKIISCKKIYEQVNSLRKFRRLRIIKSGRRLNQVKLLLITTIENLESRKKRF